jgi:Flp pilus assembly protein TadD
VLKINPRAAAAQVQLAQLNMEQGQAGVALQLATDAAKQLSGDPRVQLTLARTLIANNRLEQAGQTLAALQKQYPGIAEVHTAAGALALAKKDAGGARRAFQRATEIAPGDLDALGGLVRLDLLEKKPESARARVDSQLGSTPDNPDLLTLAARVYSSTGDARRAEELLKKVIELDSSNMPAFAMLGQIYASENRLAEARASFEAMLKQRPDSVGVTTLIGTLYDQEGNRTEARRRYERAIQLDPNAGIAANNLAYIYAEEGGNLDIALQLAQAARQKMPENPDVADTLGWVYVKKDLPQLAIPRLEEAVAAGPRNPLFRYHLGVALFKAGQKTRARQVLEKALELKLPEPAAAEARTLLAS